jgi:hypothetical protein
VSQLLIATTAIGNAKATAAAVAKNNKASNVAIHLVSQFHNTDAIHGPGSRQARPVSSAFCDSPEVGPPDLSWDPTDRAVGALAGRMASHEATGHSELLVREHLNLIEQSNLPPMANAIEAARLQAGPTSMSAGA